MSIKWKSHVLTPVIGVVAGLAALTGCASAGATSGSADQVSIVGFSAMKTAN